METSSSLGPAWQSQAPMLEDEGGAQALELPGVHPFPKQALPSYWHWPMFLLCTQDSNRRPGYQGWVGREVGVRTGGRPTGIRLLQGQPRGRNGVGGTQGKCSSLEETCGLSSGCGIHIQGMHSNIFLWLLSGYLYQSHDYTDTTMLGMEATNGVRNRKILKLSYYLCFSSLGLWESYTALC